MWPVVLFIEVKAGLGRVGVGPGGVALDLGGVGPWLWWRFVRSRHGIRDVFGLGMNVVYLCVVVVDLNVIKGVLGLCVAVVDLGEVDLGVVVFGFGENMIGLAMVVLSMDVVVVAWVLTRLPSDSVWLGMCSPLHGRPLK